MSPSPRRGNGRRELTHSSDHRVARVGHRGMSIAVTPAEHRARREALIARAREQDLSGVVLFDNTYVLYSVGVAFIPAERPIALVLSAGGEAALVVPRREVEHAQQQPGVDRVEHYDEYPGDPRAEGALTRTLAAFGIRGRVGT